MSEPALPESPRVRGTAALNAVRWVRDRFGPHGHEQVMRALPADRCAALLGPLRDASWVDLGQVLAYLEAAHRLLAPEDARFFRDCGRDAGLQIAASGVKALLSNDPHAAASRASFLWGHFYDRGRISVVTRGPREIELVIHGFTPQSRAWCERSLGFLDGCFELAGLAGRVVEESCSVEGAPECRIGMSWDAAGG